MMKCLLVVCDGMADRPLVSLKGKTPLESAKTPNLDRLASSGICGIVDTIAPGIRPGSDTAHLAILGYDPLTSYTGRGPFEAAGVGMEVKPGDVAFRCNFATLDKSGVVVDRRAGRIDEGTDELSTAINSISLPGVDLSFMASTGHRGALVLSGEGLSHAVSDSDPHKEGLTPLEVRPLEEGEGPSRTAGLLNSFSEAADKALRDHPVNRRRAEDGKMAANTLLLRGAGAAPHLQQFKDKYGLQGGVIATVALVKGVGRFCGLDVLGAKPETSISKLGRLALEATDKYDFILLNIKAADDATHDGDTEKKIAAIEEIDKTLAQVIDFTEENYLALLSDHTSSISRRDHSGDPVPLLISGPEVRTDDVEVFGERSAAAGGLGRIRGTDIINIIVDLMNRSRKFGA